MRNRFKCNKCKKIFYLVDRSDLTDKESRKSVVCTPCFKRLVDARTYQEYLERKP